MREFMRHFARERQGVWICLEPATLERPEGRIQVAPGTRFVRGIRFMNVDVAKLLEDEWARHRPRVRD